MGLRLTLGLVMSAVAFSIAGYRAFWLLRLARQGQPAPGRTEQIPERLKAELTEVIGQRKLLKWTGPGLAHAFTFWGFVILNLTIVEAYGSLFKQDFAFPWVGHWAIIGFVEDLVAVGVLAGLAAFAVIRLKNSPKTLERKSRFFGSHTRTAWLILAMISLVIVTLFGMRGAQINNGVFPYRPVHWAFASNLASKVLPTSEGVETSFILAQLGVVLTFLVLVVYSKHLHIFLAPINVLTKRVPDALGPLLPMMSDGKPINFEDPGEDDVFGRGKVEDFTWKGILDFATCTECGRCQSQCPAWNTGKPLSPKLVITELRDHLFAKAPYLLGKELPTREDAQGAEPLTEQKEAEFGDHDGHRFVNMPENERPLVGTLEQGGVIDPDVLWSCTTCGACVEQCPVDIEHIDHIIDMRRYQVLIESSFPSEAGVMLKNLESKGNPWGMNASARLDWMEGLPFEVRVVEDKIPDDVEWLYWVGCAGSLEDRAKKVTRAFAELLHIAGVEFAVLGPGESCTGDPARRLGNEFVFQMLAQQNVEALNEAKATRIVATCPHCFNTLAREYPQLGGNYEVIHHTQLLSALIDEGRLVPVKPVEEFVTYHDPCYLGRHNKVYTPPREVLEAVPGIRSQEMHRHKERGFCCGAGGARMWMEEKIGKRINVERVDEALALEPDLITTACPFCMVMLNDAVTAKKGDGGVKDSVEVLDVAQILHRSVDLSAIRRQPALVGASTTGASTTGASTTGASSTPAPEPEAAAHATAPQPTEDAPPPPVPTEEPEPEPQPEPEPGPVTDAVVVQTETSADLAAAQADAELSSEPDEEPVTDA
ncbi:MAG: hypothetical protein QOE64_642, partial [Frankiales bacterium]|nr:hypothetical protein [Frankiales bacterium]